MVGGRETLNSKHISVVFQHPFRLGHPQWKSLHCLHQSTNFTKVQLIELRPRTATSVPIHGIVPHKEPHCNMQFPFDPCSTIAVSNSWSTRLRKHDLIQLKNFFPSLTCLPLPGALMFPVVATFFLFRWASCPITHKSTGKPRPSKVLPMPRWSAIGDVHQYLCFKLLLCYTCTRVHFWSERCGFAYWWNYGPRGKYG